MRLALQSVEEEDKPVIGINITPLVDVCLVLVIIFMVTAPMFMDPAMKITLPKARTQEGEEKEKITITLAPDGRVAVNNKIIEDRNELIEEIKLNLAMSYEKFVILRADKDALCGRLTDLMAVAKEAGAKSLTIATEKKVNGK